MPQRPPNFRVNLPAMRRLGVVFAGLGGMRCPGTLKYADSSGFGNDASFPQLITVYWAVENSLPAVYYGGADAGFLSAARPVWSSTDATQPMAFAAWIRTSTSARCVLSQFTSGDAKRFMVSTGLSVANKLNVFHGGHVTASATTITDGVAHHVAGIRSAAGVWQLYVDGKPDGSTGTASSACSDAFLKIGTWGAGSTLLGFEWDVLCFQGCPTSPFTISALADPSNVMLRVGRESLLLPPRRRVFPAVAAGGPTFKPYWIRRSSQVIGGGVA